MKNHFTKALLLSALFFGNFAAIAQQAPTAETKSVSNYNYHDAFAPNFYTKNGTATRSASGQPGEKYWQNRADYQLTANLNDKTSEIIGTETLTYTNNRNDFYGFNFVTTIKFFTSCTIATSIYWNYSISTRIGFE